MSIKAINEKYERVAKNWIQKAIKSPGSLREHYNVPEGENIPRDKMEKDQARLRKKSKDGTITKEESKLLRRINMALTLRSKKVSK